MAKNKMKHLQPTVSVCMITYNHEKYIKEAIEGVLMQQCNFDLELVIANDCSTDQTDDVIQDVLNHHPKASLIKYFKHNRNKGMMPNFIWALNQCKGKYIALCDGDDYWVDNRKIQIQVNFLEKNIDYISCFHNAYILREHSNTDTFVDWNNDKLVQKEEIIVKGGGIYPTSSLLFRNEINLPEFCMNTKAGDTALIYNLINKGKFHFSTEIMSVYRIHKNGVYTSIKNSPVKKMADIKSNLSLLINYRNFYLPNYQDIFNLAIQKQLKRVSNQFGIFKVIKLYITNCIKFYDFWFFLKRKIIVNK